MEAEVAAFEVEADDDAEGDSAAQKQEVGEEMHDLELRVEEFGNGV